MLRPRRLEPSRNQRSPTGRPHHFRLALRLVEASCSLREEGLEPLGEVPPVRDARQLLELPVEVVVESVHPCRLVEQPLGHAVGTRRPRGKLRRQGTRLVVGALGRVDGGDQAKIERRAGVEARVEEGPAPSSGGAR